MNELTLTQQGQLFRTKARELRLLAGVATGSERDSLMQAAENWDVLAREAEAHVLLQEGPLLLDPPRIGS